MNNGPLDFSKGHYPDRFLGTRESVAHYLKNRFYNFVFVPPFVLTPQRADHSRVRLTVKGRKYPKPVLPGVVHVTKHLRPILARGHIADINGPMSGFQNNYQS